MKQYSVSELRDNLARALDLAERGETVVVSRRGQRFRIVAATVKPARARTPALFKLTDTSLLEGGWTWEWAASNNQLQLRKRRPKDA